MTDDIHALDGNAAAGRLGQFFAFDVTTAEIACGDCGHEGPLAELRLYGRAAGVVLRCRRCDAVNIRMLETDRSTNLDLSGAARITIRSVTAVSS
jgi:hypothetical protein